MLLVFLLSFYLYLRFLRDRVYAFCGFLCRCGKAASFSENRDTEAEIEDMRKEIKEKKMGWVKVKKTKVGQKAPLIIEKSTIKEVSELIFKWQLANIDAVVKKDVAGERKGFYDNNNWLAHEQWQESFFPYLMKMRQEIARIAGHQIWGETTDTIKVWNKSMAKHFKDDTELLEVWKAVVTQLHNEKLIGDSSKLDRESVNEAFRFLIL